MSKRVVLYFGYIINLHHKNLKVYIKNKRCVVDE